MVISRLPMVSQTELQTMKCRERLSLQQHRSSLLSRQRKSRMNHQMWVHFMAPESSNTQDWKSSACCVYGRFSARHSSMLLFVLPTRYTSSMLTLTSFGTVIPGKIPVTHLLDGDAASIYRYVLSCPRDLLSIYLLEASTGCLWVRLNSGPSFR